MSVLARGPWLVEHDPVAPELPLLGLAAARRAQSESGRRAVVKLGPMQLVGWQR